MTYLGNTPTTQSFISGTDYFNGDGTTVAFTLSRAVGSINDIEVVVNNVEQQPNTVYSVNVNTLTFTTAPSSGTQNIYVRYLSTVSQSIVPSQGTVNTAQLGLITTIPTTGGNTITLPASTGTVALTSAPTFTGQATIPTINLTGGQIAFPATQNPSSDANTLDDYEEGTFTPVVTPTGGAITSYTISNSTYTKVGRQVTANFTITITNNGTGSGFINATLPFSSASGTTSVGAGREDAVNGKMLQILVNQSTNIAAVFNYDNTYPGGTNYRLNCTVTYFAA